MNSQKEIWYNTFAIISEPGDATQYEYMVYRDGPDEFCFMPMATTFRFPQRLNYYSVKDLPTSRKELMDNNDNPIDNEPVFKMANEENCNVNTLMECIRTVKLLHERSMK